LRFQRRRAGIRRHGCSRVRDSAVLPSRVHDSEPLVLTCSVGRWEMNVWLETLLTPHPAHKSMSTGGVDSDIRGIEKNTEPSGALRRTIVYHESELLRDIGACIVRGGPSPVISRLVHKRNRANSPFLPQYPIFPFSPLALPVSGVKAFTAHYTTHMYARKTYESSGNGALSSWCIPVIWPRCICQQRCG